MKKILSYVTILCGIFLSAIAFALSISKQADKLNMYENPDAKSKVVATLDNDKQFIQIFSTEKKDWVKVANPENGDVGWVKADELKGPVIITQVNGSKIQQQIVSGKNSKDNKPIVYKVVQYSGPNELKPEEAEKAIKEMEKRHNEMRKSMQKMQEDMQKSMQEMFKEFDK